MDNAITPWPAHVRRIRFLLGLKQADLAEQLGVDQCTVSRWERNLCIPETSVQRRVRDMLRRLEPAISRSFIEEAPSIVVIGRMESVGLISAASPAATAPYQLNATEMRDLSVYDITSESTRGFMEAVDSNPAWRHGEIAMWNVVLRRPDGNWARFTGAPIGNMGFFLGIGGAVPPPHGFADKDYQLTFQAFDELCD